MDDLPPEILVEEARIAEGLQRCGLARTGFTVKYEDDLQGFEIVVSRDAGATESSVECIHNVVGYEAIRFDKAEVQQAYDNHVHALLAPQMRADNERFLRERGLLEMAPTLDKIGDLPKLASEMERLCGFEPGSALTVDGDSLTMGGEGSILLEADYEQTACLLALIRYSGVAKFGFVGNEKFRAEDE